MRNNILRLTNTKRFCNKTLSAKKFWVRNSSIFTFRTGAKDDYFQNKLTSYNLHISSLTFCFLN